MARNNTRYVPVWQCGRVSLAITIPIEVTRNLGLQAGDTAFWSAEGDTLTLKFYRTAEAAASEQKESVQGEAAVDA
jgi:hypothetical protein